MTATATYLKQLGKKLTRSDATEHTYRSVREMLVSELTREEFGDLYAQTLTYGMFATRI